VADGPVVLAVDVGGSHVKVLTSKQTERRRFVSGSTLTAQEMVGGVVPLVKDWPYDVVSIGIPAPVRGGKVTAEPVNLGTGWVGFDFESAFGKPTKVVNDAVMQAIGSYDGGRMLFLGLGTGLGSTFIADGVVVPLELAHLPFRKKTFEAYVGSDAMRRVGRKKWVETVFEVVGRLKAAIEPDYVVLEAQHLSPLGRRGLPGSCAGLACGGGGSG